MKTVEDFVKDLKAEDIFIKLRPKDGFKQIWFWNRKKNIMRHLADMKDSDWKMLCYIKNIGCDQTSFAITNEIDYKARIKTFQDLIVKIK